MTYLMHFEKEYKGCGHYLGFCEDGNLESRLKKHKSGNGAKLLKALNQANIKYEIVRIWQNEDRNFERRLKNQKNSKRFCPVCNPYNYWNRGIKR